MGESTVALKDYALHKGTFWIKDEVLKPDLYNRVSSTFRLDGPPAAFRLIMGSMVRFRLDLHL